MVDKINAFNSFDFSKDFDKKLQAKGEKFEIRLTQVGNEYQLVAVKKGTVQPNETTLSEIAEKTIQDQALLALEKKNEALNNPKKVSFFRRFIRRLTGYHAKNQRVLEQVSSAISQLKSIQQEKIQQENIQSHAKLCTEKLLEIKKEKSKVDEASISKAISQVDSFFSNEEIQKVVLNKESKKEISSVLLKFVDFTWSDPGVASKLIWNTTAHGIGKCNTFEEAKNQWIDLKNENPNFFDRYK